MHRKRYLETTWGDLQVAIAAAATAPAYASIADHLRGVTGWQDFRSLPFSTKDDFRADFRAFLTGRPAVRLHSTSGSTGAPAFVVYSREELESITTRAAITMQLAGVRAGDTVLNLFGYGTFIAGNLYDWGATRLGALLIPFGSASMTPPRFAAEALRAMRPAVVNGVPSYLTRFLGDLRRAGESAVEEIRIVQCAGEVLTPGLRQRLADVLPAGAEIYDQYGMTEFGPIAAECEAHDGMHLIDHGLYVEVVDDEGRAVEEGEGELVVTSAQNRAMALLRYRTGDRVEVSGGECACGRPGRRVVVQHRTDDLTKVRGCLCSKQEMVEAVRAVEGVDGLRIVIYADQACVDRVAVEVSARDGEIDQSLAGRVQMSLKDRARIKADRVEVVEAVEIAKTVSGKPRLLVDERADDGTQRKAS
jgi:phenylacetate-CoA ligase